MQNRWQLLLSLTFAAQVAMAADAPQRNSKTPAHNPEWTNPTDADPGTAQPSPSGVRAASPARSQMSELQKIVVLCAKNAESAEFKQAWGAYVEQYHQPDAKLDRAIEDVLTRASAYRQSRHSSTGNLTWTAAERQQARQVMQDTAMAVIRKVGG